MALTNFLKDIADAIRYAEQSNAPINAQQFATRIRALSGGQPTPPATETVEITYSFDNDIAGNASGVITLLALNADGVGNYDIMWGNADGIMENYSAINSTVLPLTETESVTYSHLIEVNAIPKYATKVLAIKDNEIKAEYSIPTNKLWNSGNYGEHLYSVELLSDVHYQYESGSEDWQKAFIFGRDRESVSAICIAGDLTDYGSEKSMNQWKTARDSIKGSTPIYSSAGNHEAYASYSMMVTNPNSVRPYLDSDATAEDLPYFYKIINNDVYVFVACFDGGVVMNASAVMFTDAQLTWLENLLETYRNQRVFLFQHIFPYHIAQFECGHFGNANNVYTYNNWYKKSSTTGTPDDRDRFMALMEHYKNVIWFSGHSHLKWYLQEVNPTENYYRWKNGARLVHIPSLTVPRDIVDSAITEYIYADSEGAMLDVYTDCVIVRGRNFVDEKYLGIASYLLDTTPINIPAKETPTEKTLTSISATKTKTSYKVGEMFEYSDIVVTAHYSDGTSENVTNDASIDTSNVNTSSANVFEVPITYMDKTTSISITVTSVTPSSGWTVISGQRYIASQGAIAEDENGKVTELFPNTYGTGSATLTIATGIGSGNAYLYYYKDGVVTQIVNRTGKGTKDFTIPSDCTEMFWSFGNVGSVDVSYFTPNNIKITMN